MSHSFKITAIWCSALWKWQCKKLNEEKAKKEEQRDAVKTRWHKKAAKNAVMKIEDKNLFNASQKKKAHLRSFTWYILDNEQHKKGRCARVCVNNNKKPKTEQKAIYSKLWIKKIAKEKSTSKNHFRFWTF